jgi:hypothetical protein
VNTKRLLLLLAVGLVAVLSVFWWLQVPSPPPRRPAPATGPPPAFAMGKLILFQPDDPQGDIPPVPPVAHFVQPAGPVTIKKGERLPCILKVDVPKGGTVPATITGYILNKDEIIYHTMDILPKVRDQDGSYLFEAALDRALPSGSYTMFAACQVIYRKAKSMEDDNAIDKVYYFDSPRVKIEVR